MKKLFSSLMVASLLLTGCTAKGQKSVTDQALEYLNTIKKADYTVIYSDEPNGLVVVSTPEIETITVKVGEKITSNYSVARHASTYRAAVTECLEQVLHDYSLDAAEFANYFSEFWTEVSYEEFLDKGAKDALIEVTVNKHSYATDVECIKLIANNFLKNDIQVQGNITFPSGDAFYFRTIPSIGSYTYMGI